ncbi:Ribulokinase-like protein [Scheffersomyces coipomensis]|uniref:Ribulokinase-like protein n=1 Tax=Scheffersomyces coipomensis TaxID=1788519 RepID=UPI00315D2B94
MATVGIDIGTGSVRVCYHDAVNGIFESYDEPITTYNVNDDIISQSSNEIFRNILKLLNKLNHKDYVAVSTAATCSMVVTEIQEIITSNEYIVESFHLPTTIGSQSNIFDIFLWMDNKATKETNELNQSLPSSILNRVGKKLVPELGIPKLKYLQSIYPDKKFIVFEFYDWIHNLLSTSIGSKRIVTLNPQSYADDSYALDGSIKGWSSSTLKDLFHIDNIQVGGFQQDRFGIENHSLLPWGYPVGQLSTEVKQTIGISKDHEVIIANGCIDCYAGWLSTIVNPDDFNNGICTMVAGTSTCFLYPGLSKANDVFVDGIWGPFKISDDIHMYEFGQPATGKLFERLFQNYEKTIRKIVDVNDSKLVFDYIETEIQKYEVKYHKSINQMIKNYFYYGDVFGNRSPLNDFSMSEMIIDGMNSESIDEAFKSISIISDESSDERIIQSLIIKYNLILEFLCFQTKQMIDGFHTSGVNPIKKLVMVGSQSHNKRFVELLSNILQLPIITLDKEDKKYDVVKGASIMARVGVELYQDKELEYGEGLQKILSEHKIHTANIRETIPSDKDRRLLEVKYEIFIDMCNRQQKYRDMMRAV